MHSNMTKELATCHNAIAELRVITKSQLLRIQRLESIVCELVSNKTLEEWVGPEHDEQHAKFKHNKALLVFLVALFVTLFVALFHEKGCVRESLFDLLARHLIVFDHLGEHFLQQILKSLFSVSLCAFFGWHPSTRTAT